MGTDCRLVEEVMTKLLSITLENRNTLVEPRLKRRVGIDVEDFQIETEFALKSQQRFRHVVAKVAPLARIQRENCRSARPICHPAP